MLVVAAVAGGLLGVAHASRTPGLGLLVEAEAADASDGSGAAARAPMPAPEMTFTAADRARFATLPATPGKVPVLLFHQVCPDVCGPEATYGVTQTELMKMLLAVQSAGYTTITIADYVRAMQGETADLPARPLLVTFDDGRLDAYRGADDVLRAVGARATMYVMTAELNRNPAFRMLGAEVDAAFASGRWDIQLHAHGGHVRVHAGVDDTGAPALMPFYASRKHTAGDIESFAAWKARTEDDVSTGQSLLAARIGGARYASLTFAVPFGDYGQQDTNDPAIAPAFRSFLDARFAVWFTQPSEDPDFSAPSTTESHEAPRFTIYRTTTAELVYDWLARHATPSSL